MAEGSGPGLNAGPTQRAQRQQKLEELCAATLRALTGDARLNFRGKRLHRDARPLPLPAPHLRTDSEVDSLGDLRATADGMALRLLHSDAGMHRRRCPADPVERLVFDLLEQFRVETLLPTEMPGMAVNLHRRFEAWSQDFLHSRVMEGRLGPMLFTVAQICRSRLTGRPVGEDAAKAMETTWASLAPHLGPALAGLRRHRADQSAFADHALEIARIVGESVRALRAQSPEGDVAEDEPREVSVAFALLLDFDEGDTASFAVAGTGASRALGESQHGYRVYTIRYDTEVAAATRVRRALLREYRERLDQRIAAQGINVTRLARQLGAVLAVPRRDGWQFGEDEGYVDGRRLARLVSTPAERRVFRREQDKPVAECQLSFLIDCSGSMKAQIEAVATLVDVLVRALDTVGVRTEVLGFTTGAWNGGRPYREWLSRGRPRNPGRLNEVCHLVFKGAEESWRRARLGISALLKADLFREGIDGEAVDWACNRMLARREARRILIVISDGCPMDSATGLANDPFYLDNHLKEVVARREREGAIEILAAGVGLDLSPFYRRRIATDMTRGLDNAVFSEIVQLIAGRRRR